MEVTKKIFDFLSGATYALNNNVQKVANNIFIFAFANVDIAGSITKPHISANQPVYNSGCFHIPFYGLDGLFLIGRFVVYERSLQLLLNIGIRRKSKSLLLFSPGVESYQFPDNILHPVDVVDACGRTE